jgi:YVTN family beta-propeller protein
MTALVRDKGLVQAPAAPVRVVKGGFMSLGTASVRPPGRRMQSRRALAALAASGLVATLALTAVAAPAHASSGDRMAYVTNAESSSVSVIDTTTNTVTATVRVGSDPISAAVSPDGSTVYVANEGSNSVSVINAATDTVTATIAVGVVPDAVAVSPDGSLLYVGCDISLGPAVGGIDVVNTSTDTVTASIETANQPDSIAFTPDGAEAYVANFVGSSVSVIDTATSTVTATIASSDALTPASVAITPDGAHVYSANFNSNNVSVISTASNTITTTIPGLNGPEGVSVTPDGGHAYVTDGNGNTVSVVDTATNTITGTIAVGSIPDGIAADPAGGAVYVVNAGSNTVSVIDTASNTVTGTIAVGSLPFDIAMAPAPATTTSLSSSSDPSVYGQLVTVTATVTPTDGGGTVAFYADGSATAISGCGTQPLTLASGSTYTATCTTSSLSAGSHPISASYSGDGGSSPASSGSLATGQTVNPAPLTITASSGSMAYDGTPPAITASYSGFVNGDGPGSLSTAPTCSTTATSSSPVGSYPSSCSGGADPNYAISYIAGQVNVAQASTALAYTGPSSVSAQASLVPSATLSSPASACQTGQPVSFTLDANPATGAAGSYLLESATTTSAGAATGASISTTGWQAGAYTITASYAGTANCTASTTTEPLTVTTPGLAAAGAGSYPLAGGTVGFGFIVAKTPRSGAYQGGISLVSPGAWQLTGTLKGYTKSSPTQGTVTGTGSLYWWNQSLNNHRGGWQLARTGVAFAASFGATSKNSRGSFGIQISYTPAPSQPPALPNSSPVSLKSGVIAMA